MPDRTYSLHNRRLPSWRDHMLAHPGEVVLAGWSVVIGVIMLGQVFADGFEPSRSLAALPGPRHIDRASVTATLTVRWRATTA